MVYLVIAGNNLPAGIWLDPTEPIRVDNSMEIVNPIDGRGWTSRKRTLEALTPRTANSPLAKPHVWPVSPFCGRWLAPLALGGGTVPLAPLRRVRARLHRLELSWSKYSTGDLLFSTRTARAEGR